jgi:hypothetical protein
MKTSVPFKILAVLGPVFLLGCSTPQPVPVAEPVPATLALIPGVPAHGLAPDERFAPKDPVYGRACQLGTSCLALDPRPFEICLLGSNKRCGDKIKESLLIDNPVAESRP